eukprot:TRINITY_DN20327_c0_g1_i1.p1 TRINITY_DN20327_c0_g1~~TRINITY_DN20327_c0_g1_i1.p1  ORF type:complete len:370 (+),score=51.29 TRINITY_DN20327_c0_g1_i1:48-1112(+)
MEMQGSSAEQHRASSSSMRAPDVPLVRPHRPADTRSDSSAGSSLNTAHQPLAAANPPLPRVYEVYSQLGGHNQFFCCGRCVTGPTIDFWYNMCAWGFIMIPSGFYFLVCSKYLAEKVSIWLPIVTALVLLATIIFLLLTSCTDPGILPRHDLRVAVDGLDERVVSALGETLALPELDPVSREPICQLTDEQQRQGYRWCVTCKVVRPPRSSHCNDCNNCVLMFDHHCPFVNNCVGQRNYAFFSAFLVSTGCLGFAVVAGIGIYLSDEARNSRGPESLTSNPLLCLMVLVIGVPTAVLLIGVLGLMIFHIYLASRGRTTREVFTGKITIAGRTLFHLRGPSLMSARSRISVPLTV